MNNEMMFPKLPRLNTHKASLLYFLLSGESFMNKDMRTTLDTNYSASRISELRSDGWEITDIVVDSISNENKPIHPKRYFMKASYIMEQMLFADVKDFVNKFRERDKPKSE